ncbi:MAG: hypothetical protein AB8C46_14005 [Burkholderiaceae bacterium]
MPSFKVSRWHLLLASCVLTLAACGGGGGDGGGGNGGGGRDDTVVGNDPDVSNCRAGVIAGFSGDFGDAPVSVTAPAEGEGGDGVGGIGEGSPGIGAGGSLGQFINTDVTVEFASGQRYGPVRVDAEKGMVTIVPCELAPPVLVTLTGAPGSGAQYFDEALRRSVSFEGLQLRSVITSFQNNAGITTFTEAMVRRAERNANTAFAPGGIAKSAAGQSSAANLKARPTPKQAWKSVADVNQAHDDVLTAVNNELPGVYRLTDLRRLPVILNENNLQNGSGVLSDNQNGIYGAVLAGAVSTAAANLGRDGSPALEVTAQLADDLSDGVIDLTKDKIPVATDQKVAYTPDTLWSFQTINATQIAREAGVGAIASSVVPIGRTLVAAKSDANGGSGLLGNGRLELIHSSDGSLRYIESADGCPTSNRVFQNVRQKKYFSAIGQDGKTFYSALFGPQLCSSRFVTSFDVDGATMASLSSSGDVVRTTDGRFFYFQPLSFTAASSFSAVNFSDETPIAIENAFEFLWTLSDSATVTRYTFEFEFGGLNPGTQAYSVDASTARPVALPDPVRQLKASGDDREFFALTSAGEVYWLKVNDASGRRDPQMTPTPVRLELPPICWISKGVVAIACDGDNYFEIKTVTDTSLPPIVDRRDAVGRPFFVPGVSGVQVIGPRQSSRKLWRSTDEIALADGAIASIDLSSPPRLITVDGALLSLEGEVVQ